MKKESCYFMVLSFLLVLVIPTMVHAGMGSANYRSTATTLSCGGKPMTSVSYAANATAGQPSGIGPASGTSYELHSGFWPMTLMELIISLAGDVNGDGETDLADVIMTLKLLSGISTDIPNLKADVDKNSRIGMPEAVYIMQYVSGQR